MKHFKVNVGRKKLSSEYIQSKQNFETVLSGVKVAPTSFWKSVWFYGTIGMAGVATVVGYKFYKSEKEINETIITKDLLQQNEYTLTTKLQHEPVVSYQYVDEVKELTTTVAPSQVSITKIENRLDKQEALVDKKMYHDEELLQVVEAEPELPKVKKPRVNSMPSISGVYNGDISWESFKDGIVFVGEDISVKQFTIQYTTRMGDKITSVKGSRIPVEVAQELEKLGLNQTIFITNVVAGDEQGSTMRFVSMDLNLKFN